MTTKTLKIYVADETDQNLGAVLTFTTHKLERNQNTYVFKTPQGDIVAKLTLSPKAIVREL